VEKHGNDETRPNPAAPKPMRLRNILRWNFI
jgi:hypothetical protein